MVARIFWYKIVHVGDFILSLLRLYLFFFIHLSTDSVIPGAKGATSIFFRQVFFAVHSIAFIRIHISRWFCSMGHDWSYSLCDWHLMSLLRLIITSNFLDKLPNLETDVYWQMACFLWLLVFVDIITPPHFS
jgi:hypothetical protein